MTPSNRAALVTVSLLGLTFVCIRVTCYESIWIPKLSQQKSLEIFAFRIALENWSKLLEAAGLNQKQLAELVDRDETTISGLIKHDDGGKRLKKQVRAILLKRAHGLETEVIRTPQPLQLVDEPRGTFEELQLRLVEAEERARHLEAMADALRRSNLALHDALAEKASAAGIGAQRGSRSYGRRPSTGVPNEDKSQPSDDADKESS